MTYTQDQVNALLEENTQKWIEKTFEGERQNDLISKVGKYTFYSYSNLCFLWLLSFENSQSSSVFFRPLLCICLLF